MSDAGKKLNELKVLDLKDELEKRKLDTVGPKCALVQRLEKALKDEGIDPNTHIFTLNSKPQRAKSVGEGAIKIKKEPVDETEKSLEEDNAMDATEAESKEVVDESTNDVKDAKLDDEEKDGDWQEGDEVDQVGDVDDECIIIEDYPNDSGKKEEEKKELNVREEEIKADHDHEESLNLSIGEDEKLLLIDEEAEEKPKISDDQENTKQVKPQIEKISEKDEKKSSRNEKEDKSHDKEVNKSVKKEDDIKKDTETGSDKKTTSSSSKSTIKEEKEKSTTNTATSNSTSTNSTAAAINTTTNATKVSGSSSSNKSSTTSPSRNLWVSGLSSLTRASDLKTIFSKYGKVIGAKVVTNTRTPGTRCYGYVTMSSSSDATRCIDHLHRTELHGRIISVERTKNEIGTGSSLKFTTSNETSTKISVPTTVSKTSSGSSGVNSKKKDDDKKSNTTKDASERNRRSSKSKESRDDRHKSAAASNATTAGGVARTGPLHFFNRRLGHRARPPFQPHRDFEREREERLRERERIRQREMLNFQKIREERERQRLRERERELREEDRRRREIRERQREEEQRLAAERRKLALERERLEREKAELLRLERERQKLEREKLELERLELKRQQMKIIQARDEPPKRSVAKRGSVDRYADVPERKRAAANDSRFEAPPPPRFDTGLVTARSYDKKREDFVSSSSASKRNVDEYAGSSKRLDYPSGSKRAGIDDYGAVPAKRNFDDTNKRGLSSTKRSIDDYAPSSKRDDYGSKSTRDDYKREVEIRHIPERASGSSYKRGGLDDIRNASSKRYDNSSNYGGGSSSNNGVWNSSGHINHTNSGGSGSGVAVLKPYVSNPWPKTVGVDDNWRQVPSTQDRYDRNYNERSGGTSAGMYGSSGGRSGQDRYGGPVSSRY